MEVTIKSLKDEIVKVKDNDGGDGESCSHIDNMWKEKYAQLEKTTKLQEPTKEPDSGVGVEDNKVSILV